jgi:hypothetical protein
VPQTFRPYADTIARIVLVAILVLPFGSIAFAYFIMRSEYVTDQSITLNMNALPRLAAASGLLWIIFLFTLTFADYWSRS